MARKSSGTILQEELYPSSAGHSAVATAHAESVREEMDDARLVDLDVAEESPFLRGQKRVSARRSSLPRKTASRLLWATVAVAVLCVGAIVAAGCMNMASAPGAFAWSRATTLKSLAPRM